MNTKIIRINILLLFLAFSSVIVAQNQKLAQTGFKFLSISTDARAAGLADAVTSLENNSQALFYNPATMAFSKNKFDVSLGRTQWIADINYISGGATYTPGDGRYGVFGISYLAADYGQLLGTIVFPNDVGYLETGEFSPTAMSIGVGYANALSEQFAVGGNIRYASQYLGTSVVDAVANDAGGTDFIEQEHKTDALAFDFGIYYKTGWKSLAFGMSITNFSTEIKFAEEGFQLPLTFKLGISMNVLDMWKIEEDQHKLLVSIDASRPRDYAEQINIGLEYTLWEILSLRSGFSTPNDEHSFSYGVGVKKDFADMFFGLDYAYTPFGVFNDVHRFSFNFLF